MAKLLSRLLGAVRSRISVRIFIILTLLVLVPALILFFASLALFERGVREALDMELRTALDGAERDITSFLADLVAVSGVMAKDPMIYKALTEDLDPVGRVKIIDAAVDGLLTPLPGNDAIRYTFISSAGLFSSWSRNFNDYSFMGELPLVVRAGLRPGHVVWEGFSPSFIIEERGYSLVASLARSFPVDYLGPTAPGALGVLVLSAERESFKRYLAEKRPGASYSTVLLSETGEVFVSASDAPGSAALSEDLARRIGSAVASGQDMRDRYGDYLVAARSLSGLPADLAPQRWAVAVLYSYGTVARRFSEIRSIFLPAFALLLVLALAVVFLVSRRVVHPIVDLSRLMEGWDPNRAESAPVPELRRGDEVGTLYRAFDTMQGNIRELIAGIQREHGIRERYRYRALRSQLNPHFLFNSLNSIRWLAIIRKADNIVAAVDDLSSILAYSIGKDGDFSTLRSELESVSHYLAVQNLRYGGRLSLDLRVDESLQDAEVLKFMIQPVAENCVVHAYRGAAGEGCIEIGAAAAGDSLLVTVADRGAGLDLSALERSLLEGEDRPKDAGIGLRNIREMLHLTYGPPPAADLTIMNREGGGTVVRLKLPLRRRGQA